MADTIQITACGFGGQGILLIGGLLGEAAVRDGLWAAGSSSYGAQARGSACRSELVLSREPADYPHVLEADLLIAMSQESYARYLLETSPQGLVIHDHPEVVAQEGDRRLHVPVPATATAVERFASRQVANVVMLAALVALTGLVSRDSLTGAVVEGVDARFREANLKALEAGLALGDGAEASFGPGLEPWRARAGLGCGGGA